MDSVGMAGETLSSFQNWDLNLWLQHASTMVINRGYNHSMVFNLWLQHGSIHGSTIFEAGEKMVSTCLVVVDI